ncbi:hypothetical protein BDV33DRAFT_167201 [Aspergillus novoparasiticus]|uniref:Uncharacterized protein n=1 Tax=Aspergillus novoparasiticus TaxID=986946 RepID=A0A5N6F1C4_9EURO|nr:hypothetical protein BDV33DRAFT_167201 [Aspergillus novoparasiticus]
MVYLSLSPSLLCHVFFSSGPISCLHFRPRLSVDTRTHHVENCGLQGLVSPSVSPKNCSTATNVGSPWPATRSRGS